MLRESSFNMTRGEGWRYWDSKLEILAAPLASGSIFLGAPLSPVGFEVYKFSEPPFRVSKRFRSPHPLNIFVPPVILNELSLKYTDHYVCIILPWSIHFATLPEWKFAGCFLKYGSRELLTILTLAKGLLTKN